MDSSINSIILNNKANFIFCNDGFRFELSVLNMNALWSYFFEICTFLKYKILRVKIIEDNLKKKPW